MFLGVKLIDVATDTLSDLVDGKLAVVEVDLLNVTIVEFRDRKLGAVLFDNVVEEELELLGTIEAEPLGDALVVRFLDEEVRLLRSNLVDEVPKSLGDALVDKLTEIEFELLFVKMVGVSTRTFGVALIEKSREVEVDLLCVLLVGLERETPGDTLVDKLAEVEVELLRIILINVATETLDDDGLVDKFTDV